jgi:hypothetical protein
MFDVSQYYEYFILLGFYVVYVNIFCTVGVIYASSRVNSGLITLVIIALFNLLMKYLQLKMTPMFETNLELVQHLWYITFVCCWLLSIYVINKLHELTGTELGKLAKTVVFSYLFVASFTLIKYIFRIHLEFDLDLLNAVYSGIVNAVNVTVAILSLVVTIAALGLKFMNFKRIY